MDRKRRWVGGRGQSNVYRHGVQSNDPCLAQLSVMKCLFGSESVALGNSARGGCDSLSLPRGGDKMFQIHRRMAKDHPLSHRCRVTMTVEQSAK